MLSSCRAATRYSASASAASASAAAPAPLVIEYPSMGSVLAAPWTAIKTKRNARGYTAWAGEWGLPVHAVRRQFTLYMFA